MKQYHDLLNEILEEGTYKEPARENMPTTTSLFGYQMDPFNLEKGFPILTTKKVNFKHIVTELLWFLRGDTNVKFLNDNGVRIWNQDSYNYYKKVVKNSNLSWEEFESILKGPRDFEEEGSMFYKYGDCGYQYGKVWRDFNGVDQISRLIDNLRNSPEGRRHVITAVDPRHDDQLALYWCHSMFQFNARPIPIKERILKSIKENKCPFDIPLRGVNINDAPIIIGMGDVYGFIRINNIPALHKKLDEINIPKYYLDCKMYQRSADSFLGVPYNISSYALLTSLIAELVNMVPGKYIHTFGDVHIYSNHMDQVNEILGNDVNKYSLPNLEFSDNFLSSMKDFNDSKLDFDEFIRQIGTSDIYLEGYQSYKLIKAELSTGIKK